MHRLKSYHINQMIRNLSRLMVDRIRERENRPQLIPFSLKRIQNLLDAF